MDNQTNVGDQNAQQIGQFPEKPKINYLVIGLVILICFVLFGLGGYYLGSQSSLIKQNTSLKQPQSSPTPTIAVDPMANWKTIIRKNWQFKVPNNWNYLECSNELIFVGPKIEKDQTSECAFDFSPALIQVSRTSGQNSKIPTNTDPKLDPYISEKTTFVLDDKTAIRQRESISDGQGQGVRISIYIENQTYTDEIILHDIDQKETFDQILSTFKFTSPTSTIPKSISDLFSAINTKFNVNLIPVEENEFYSPSGMITKKSWKIDLMDTAVVSSGKGFITFLRSQLSPNDVESGGIGGGGTDGYQNDSIKCFHTYMSEMPSGKQTTNFLSCAEK